MPSLALVWDLIANDSASPAFARVGVAAEEAAAKTEAATAKTSTAMSTIAKAATGAGIVVAAVSVKMAADFQQSLTKLATTAGESTDNLKMVGDGMLAMAGQVGIGAEELAKGMYTVESSGIHGADALNVLKAAAEGAKQENADLGKVTDAVTTALHDYSMPASAAATVTSQLVTAVSHGKTTFDELTGAMHSITPLAAALGVPLADVAGSLSAMTASGESADQAAQNMADALRHLQGPTQPMIDELGQLGINAADLAGQLGTKGLSGTIQGISQAILEHMGPSGKVMLDAFNQSQVAANDAAIMFDKLPPALQEVATAYESGTMTVGDWRKAVKGMPADQQMLATSWKTLTDKAGGFSQILKSGKPDAQEYTVALQKAMGTSAGLTVALQLTGEHADATNAAILDIANSAAQADGNIKGWDEVQGNFNQQLSEFTASLESAAIAFGQHLLPALTSGLSWLNNTGVPAVKGFASGVSDLVGKFQELPQPVKTATEAFIALKVASSLGILSTVGSAFTAVGTAAKSAGLGVMGLRDEMALQQALMAAEARDAELAATGLANVSRALGATSAAAGEATASMTAVQLSMRGLDAALAATAIEEDVVAASTSRMGTAMSVGLAQGIAGVSAAGEGLMAMLGGPWGLAMIAAGVAVAGLVSWLRQDHDIIPQVTVDTQSLTSAIEANNGAIDGNVRRTAAKALQDSGMFKAAQQWGVSLSTLTDAVLGQGDAMDTVRAAAAAYKQKQDDAAASMDSGSYSAGIAADAYKKAAMQSDSWMNALGGLANSTDNAVGQAKQLNDAVGTATATQNVATAATDAMAKAAQIMGADVQQAQANNAIVTKNATGQQVADLKALGLVVTNLPNHEIIVSATTDAARDAITKLTNDYHNYSINLGVGGIGAHYAAAAGGAILGPGTGTSDSIPAMLSNGEHVWTAREVSAAGGHSAIASMRKAVLSGVKAFAAGGPVLADMSLAAKVGIDPASLAAARSAMSSPTMAPGAPANVSGNVALGQILAGLRGWGSGAEWNALYALWQRESGWRNTAQNPTSTAYGIPQFLNSTWASVGAQKSSDPATQINAGLKYIGGRYGDPLKAWAHEVGAGWYEQGTSYVPRTGPAVLHEGEAVLTKAENASRRGPMQVTLQLAGDDVRSLLQGEIVTTLTAVTNRGAYNGS